MGRGMAGEGQRMKTEVLNIQSAGALERAAALLRGGEVVAFPTETVYGLGALASDAEAVRRIFLAKGRPQDNPLIVHVSDIEMAKPLAARWTPCAQSLARAFWPGPLSIIVEAAAGVAKIVRAGLSTVAIRMPAHEAARALIALAGPLAAPSANASGRPSPVRAAHVLEDLGGRIPLVLDGGPCAYAVESTVVDARGDAPVVLRPGGVTVEMLRAVCGACTLAQGVFEPVFARAASPGMLHAHYAPKGKATLIPQRTDMAAVLCAQYDAAKREGFFPVILCGGEVSGTLGERAQIRCDERGPMAHGLFDALRRADSLGYDRLFIQGVEMQGLGMAYMNRALRAAGFDVWEG
jgi:L-threonylcarbamoyladenylate synthase